MKRLFTMLFIIGLYYLPAKSQQEEDVLRPRGRTAEEVAAQNTTRSAAPSGVRWAIGLELGANYNMFSQDITGTQPNSPLNVLKSGTGIAPFGSWIIDVGFTNSLGAQLRVLYDIKDNGHTSNAQIDCPSVEPGVPPANTDIEVEYEYKFIYTTVEGLLRFNITPQLMLTAGPSFHFLRGSPTVRVKSTIISEGECFYNIGTAQQSKEIESTSPGDDLTKTLVGVDIGVGYSIPLSPTLSLVPRVGYQHIFTEVFPGSEGVDNSRAATTGAVPFTADNARIRSIQMSVMLMFNL